LDEYFSARTDFMLEVGDRRPTLYFHGFSPNKQMTAKPAPIGVATASRVDDAGLWMEVELRPSPLSDRVWGAAEAGTCRASTGAVNYLCRSAKDGEVEVWPIGELSLLDEGLDRHPVNDKAVAMPLRASFKVLDLEIPEAFGKDAGSKDEEAQSDDIWVVDTIHEGEFTMSDIDAAVKAALDARDAEAKAKVEAEAAMRAKITKELEGEPKYKALFNIKRETAGEPKDPAKAESWEWFWHLRHGGTPEMRVLEETVAGEGLPMVPQEALDSIVALRDELSLATKLALTRYQTNRLIFNVPREATAMGALAAIAEEGAYVANEPAFALLPVTVVKYGSLIAATEELLEDQNLFIPWFTKACGRAWALAENLALYTLLDTAGQSTVGVHAATMTDANLMTFFFAMTEPWRDGSKIVMSQATMAAMRALLIATPRAYGDFPLFGGGEYPSWMGMPVFLNSNWITLPSAVDLGLGMSMINPDAVAIVERRGLTIKVDPYSAAGVGTVNYYPSVRFAPVVTQIVGHVAYEGHA